MQGELCVDVPDSSYRIAFAVQWVWLLPLAMIVWFAPESPTWCVKTGRLDRARASLKRLSSTEETEEDLENRLALLEYVNESEKKVHASTSYFECFRGVNLRRTEVAAMIYACQNLDGYTLANSNGYFFQRAGLSAKSALPYGPDTVHGSGCNGRIVMACSGIVCGLVLRASRIRTGTVLITS